MQLSYIEVQLLRLALDRLDPKTVWGGPSEMDCRALRVRLDIEAERLRVRNVD